MGTSNFSICFLKTFAFKLLSRLPLPTYHPAMKQADGNIPVRLIPFLVFVVSTAARKPTISLRCETASICCAVRTGRFAKVICDLPVSGSRSTDMELNASRSPFRLPLSCPEILKEAPTNAEVQKMKRVQNASIYLYI